MNASPPRPSTPVPPGDGWHLPIRYLRLSCPRCGLSVEVLPGSTAWCSRCPGRPEMEASAT